MSLHLDSPFTFAQARAAGISPDVVRGPRFRQVLHGVYVGASVSHSLPVRARAALLIHPSPAWISHTSAAALLGISVPSDPEVHVTVPSPSQRRRRPGVATHVGSAEHVAVASGLPVTTGYTLFRALAAQLGLVDAVVAGDAMVGTNLLTLTDRPEPSRGSSRVRDALALVRMGAESPMETRSRLLLVLAGFPEPRLNLVLRHTGGHYRPDMCWPGLKLAVEYDGQHHRQDLDQWDRDIERREWFQTRGWRIITLVARDIYQRPGHTIERIHAAWREAGGPPLRLRDQWRRHYPEHRTA